MTYAEQLQKIANDYMASGEPWPATKRQIAAWAVRSGLWKPHPELLVSKCAEDLGQAMAGEHFTDPQGRSVRAKHAARIGTDWLWDDHRIMGKRHATISFALRRSQMVGECKQLKTDVDSYNENHCPDKPIQMSFNFTKDLEEASLSQVVAATNGPARPSSRPLTAASQSSLRRVPSHP